MGSCSEAKKTTENLEDIKPGRLKAMARGEDYRFINEKEGKQDGAREDSNESCGGGESRQVVVVREERWKERSLADLNDQRQQIPRTTATHVKRVLVITIQRGRVELTVMNEIRKRKRDNEVKKTRMRRGTESGAAAGGSTVRGLWCWVGGADQVRFGRRLVSSSHCRLFSRSHTFCQVHQYIAAIG